MSKVISESLVQVSITSGNSGKNLKMLEQQNEAVTRSLAQLNSANDKTTRSNKTLTEQERKLTEQRKKHSEVIRDMASNASTMVGPLNAITGRMSAFGALIGRVGVGWAVAGATISGVLYGTIAALKKVAHEMIRTEEEQLRIAGVLRATGYAAGYTASQFDKLARSIAADTLASTTGVRDSIAALAQFKKIGGENYEKVLRIAQDLATVNKRDLLTTTRQLGKALQDPVAGYQQLERLGVSLTDIQIKRITKLQKEGDLLAAQAVIIDEIKSKVGGVANIAGSGLAGNLDLLGQRWDELFERISRVGALPNELRGSFGNLMTSVLSNTSLALKSWTDLVGKDEEQLIAEHKALSALDSPFQIRLQKLNSEKASLREAIILRGNSGKSIDDLKQKLIDLNNITDGTAIRNRGSAEEQRFKEQAKRFKALESLTKDLNEQTDLAAAGKAAQEQANRDEAARKNLEANIKLYTTLFAKTGEGYEKQRREQERIHNEKLKQIEEITFDDLNAQEYAASSGLGIVQTNEQLKTALKKEATDYYLDQLDKINDTEKAKAEAERNRLLREDQTKRKLVADYQRFQEQIRGQEQTAADKWREDQLLKLQKFADDSEKAGTPLTKDQIQTESYEIDVKANQMAVDAKKLIDLEYNAWKAQLGVDEISKIDAKYALEVEKYRQMKNRMEITDEEFNNRVGVLGTGVDTAKQAEINKKKLLDLEYNAWKLQLDESVLENNTTNEMAQLDAKYELEVEKYRQMKERMEITDEEFKNRKEALEAENDDAKFTAQFGKEKEFGNAVLALKKGEAGATMNLAKMTAESLAGNSKKAFAIKKAMAIKETIMATYQNAVLAFQSLANIPYVGPILGAAAAVAAVAMGMAQVNQIRSQSVSGARANGGNVVAGQNYLVGERGPEIMTAGATGQITSYENMMKSFGVKNPGQSSSKSANISFSIQALDGEGVEKVLMKNRGAIFDAVNRSLADEGRSL